MKSRNLSKLYGPLHGWFWKCLSLGAKFLFLFAIVPGLADGIYTKYFYIQTICLLAGRFGLLGVHEHLTVEICGCRKTAEYFVNLYVLIVGLAFAAFLGYWLGGMSICLTIYLSLIFAGGSYLGGVLRTVSIESFEMLLNVAPIAFIIFCYTTQTSDAETLILGLGLCQFIAHVTALVRSKISLGQCAGIRMLPIRLIKMIPASFCKMASIQMEVMQMRSVILWPKFLGLNHLVNDSVSLAISFSEVAWQLVMVLVQRDFVGYCCSPQSARVLRNALRACGAMLVLSLFWFVPYQLSLTFITNRVAWQDLMFCSLILVAVLPAIEIRYYFWACRRGIFPLVMDSIFVAVQCLTILVFNNNHVAAIAITSLVFIVIYMLVVYYCIKAVPTTALPTDVAEVAEVENLND